METIILVLRKYTSRKSTIMTVLLTKGTWLVLCVSANMAVSAAIYGIMR